MPSPGLDPGPRYSTAAGKKWAGSRIKSETGMEN